jgi:UDP-N-acetylmuramate--alanine ligase
MFGKLRRIHFVGIGGVGMSGIALLLHNLGFEVSGSDIKESGITRKLAELGIGVKIGHQADNCLGADVLVYSSAVSPDNPEIVAATMQGVSVIPRAEMLAELMRMKFSIAVSGTHGKTTVTSLIAAVLENAGLDPTTAIGGRILGTEAGARLGQSEYLVAEADESDRSFLLLYPSVAVITNIEREHLDVYRNLAEIKRAFVDFANRVPFFGTVIAGTDSSAVRAVLPKFKRRRVSYGLRRDADLRATKVEFEPFRSSFSLLVRGKDVGRFRLNLAGLHNVQNALAVLGVAMELGVTLDQCARTFETFSGIHRRLELRGEQNGVVVMDDYGHHPTEILVTLKALRQAYPERRILVVFQPHRYTRTKFLAPEFGPAFRDANLLLMLPIYPASEPPIPGVTNQLIADAIHAAGGAPEVLFCANAQEAVTWLQANTRPSDVVLTLGAGNIWEIGRDFLNPDGRNHR